MNYDNFLYACVDAYTATGSYVEEVYLPATGPAIEQSDRYTVEFYKGWRLTNKISAADLFEVDAIVASAQFEADESCMVIDEKFNEIIMTYGGGIVDQD